MENDFHIALNRLRALIEGFAGKRVLVIGDMVADEYLVGRPTRIARDAPVLILEMYEERIVPGGATRVAVNARTLGAEVFLAGVVGDDVPGQRLREAISELGDASRGDGERGGASNVYQNAHCGGQLADGATPDRAYRSR